VAGTALLYGGIAATYLATARWFGVPGLERLGSLLGRRR
jgi:hypothetical protein